MPSRTPGLNIMSAHPISPNEFPPLPSPPPSEAQDLTESSAEDLWPVQEVRSIDLTLGHTTASTTGP